MHVHILTHHFAAKTPRSRRPGQELRLDASPPALPRRRWISTVVLVLAGSALTQGPGWNARGFYNQLERSTIFNG